MKFEGKIAVVTGAASGIGFACTKSLLQDGCVVVGMDKNIKIVDCFTEFNTFLGIKTDLKNTESIKKSVTSVIKKFGGLDILISNAGTFSSSRDLELIKDTKWANDLEINLHSHHKILRECLPYLKKGIDPSVIFMGSRNVGAPGPGAGTYTVAKSGLTQMSRLAAIELAKYKIRVNIVHPDCVYDTNIWSKSILNERASHYGLSIKDYKRRNLLSVEVKSNDVAEFVKFLVSNKASKTTGAQIPIDGGNERVI